MSNGAQYRAVIGLVAKNKPSLDFCEYWQRTQKRFPLTRLTVIERGRQ